MALGIIHMIASRAIEIMEAELGGPLASEFSGFELINGAGRLMESLHEWRYMTKTARSLSLRAQVTGTLATFTEATSTLTLVGAFAGYSLVPGDFVEMHDDTTLLGRFQIETRVGDDSITIDSPSLTADITSTVAFTVDTSRIGLPSDVERIKTVHRKRPNSGGAFASSSTELHMLDESYLTGGSYVVGYTLEWGTAVAKALPVPTLRIWPQASGPSVDALSAVYLRAWPSIDTETDIIPIPSYMESLFIEVCRIYARSFEDQDALDLRANEITGGAVFMAAARYDSGGQHYMGRPRYGAVRRRNYNHSETSAEFVQRHLEQ